MWLLSPFPSHPRDPFFASKRWPGPYSSLTSVLVQFPLIKVQSFPLLLREIYGHILQCQQSLRSCHFLLFFLLLWVVFSSIYVEETHQHLENIPSKVSTHLPHQLLPTSRTFKVDFEMLKRPISPILCLRRNTGITSSWPLKMLCWNPFRSLGFWGHEPPVSLHCPAVNLSLLQTPTFRYYLAGAEAAVGTRPPPPVWGTPSRTPLGVGLCILLPPPSDWGNFFFLSLLIAVYFPTLL